MSYGGAGIMDGDGPMDCAELFCEHMGEGCGFKGYSPTIHLVWAINESPRKVEDFLEKHRRYAEMALAIGCLAMSGGTVVTRKMRDVILEAIDKDDWDDENRVAEMARFRRELINYKHGIPVKFGYVPMKD